MVVKSSKGSRNFFRHNISARDDGAVQRLIEEFKLEGYSYWFMLLELSASQIDLDELKPIKINLRTLCKMWMVRKDKAIRILSVMEQESLISCLIVAQKWTKSCLRVALELHSYDTSGLLMVQLSIPNLPKYMGLGLNKMPIDRYIDREIDSKNSFLLNNTKSQNPDNEDLDPIEEITEDEKKENFGKMFNFLDEDEK